ncbi:DUF4105 domain-containing protein [Dyadobacter sp. 3J3]|uniref:lipoprotein N-acyltransferase Lnb domain-containing protein n=1 Tax=Dyadobacter sp. 3J3 TaxID=2606600 RepID=UPI0013595CB4|nr:DUF4105 domain-containing protein [Dyadobacter sp. 3J3]
MKLKVKNSSLIFFLLIFISNHASAQLAENSKISLLTIGPGKDVYSAFGHSAIRISDPATGIDNVYNYGTFTFDNNFYINFAKGENIYWLSVVPFKQEYYYWAIKENRTVIQQTLNLTVPQKNDLYHFLENNALVQNRTYRYDYFYDNCSNRIDNALKKVFGYSLKFYADKVAEERSQSGSTIRQLTHQYLQQSKWGELGIETCLGIEMDRKIKPEQFKFLPDFLMWNYDKAEIKSDHGFIPLVMDKIVLYQSNEQINKVTLSGYFSPIVCFSIILLLAFIISFPKFKQSILARIFDFTLFFVCGIAGFLLLFLWFFTTHYSQVNLNLLWANPLGLFLSFGLFSRKNNRIIAGYYFYYGLLLVLTILGWAILPQQLNFAYLPVCLALALRCFSAYSVGLHRGARR